MSRGSIYFVDSKIKCLQALSCWVMSLTLQVTNIDLNQFNSDVLSDAIKESWIHFEDIRNGKGGMSKPNSFHTKNGLNGRTVFTTNFRPIETVVVCPYHKSSEKIHQVLMTDRTEMCISSIKQFLSENCS